MLILEFLYATVVIGLLGFSFLHAFKIKQKEWVEGIFLYSSIGLVVLSYIILFLGYLKLINYWIILGLASIYPLFYLLKNKRLNFKKPDKLSKKSFFIYLILFLIILCFALVYLKGAFSYPYLEDDDPWSHAGGAKYVSLYDTFIQPRELPLHYLAPYPPIFTSIMGVLHQIRFYSMQSILKFFNVILISLGLFYSFFYFKELMKSKTKALISTSILAIIPCFMSHFIWAQTLSLIMWFPSLYFLEKFESVEQKNHLKLFFVAALLSITLVFITQPSTAFIFGLFLIIRYATKFAICRKSFDLLPKNRLIYSFLLQLCALLLSIALFWGPMFALYGYEVTGQHIGFIGKSLSGTSGGTIYSLNEIVFAPLVSKMNQPTGIGIVVSLLLFGSLIFYLINIKKIIKQKKDYIIFNIFWLIVCLAGIEGNALPVQLFPHRFWVYLAIAVAVLVGNFLFILYNSLKKINKFVCFIIFLIIIVGALMTSAYPKYVVETSSWPPGVRWTSDKQIQGYVNLKNLLPINTKIFNYCLDDRFIIGVDMMGEPWNHKIKEYKKISINDSLAENYKFLKEHQYEYIIIDGSCLKNFGANQTNYKLQEISKNMTHFKPTDLSNDEFFVFKVK